MLGKLVHQPGVSGAILAGGSIDTGNPKLAIGTFFQFTTYISIAHCFVHRIFGDGPDIFSSAKKAFGGLKDFFAPSSGGDSINGTWHDKIF
jgi:hypothetical protein